MANKKKRETDAGIFKALDNRSQGLLPRKNQQPNKNTTASSPINHLRKETQTSTQMYSGSGKNKSKTVQTSWNRTGNGSSGSKNSKGTKNTKGSKTTKPMNRDAKIVSSTLGNQNKKPAVMATDQAKKELDAQNNANTSPMGMLRRQGQKNQKGQNDNYTREETDARLSSSNLSSLRKAERDAKKKFDETHYTGGRTTFLSTADRKNLSETEQNSIQVWKDQWDEGQRLIDQGQTKKGKQMQAEAHEQAERIRMAEGYSGGKGGTDFVTPEMKSDEYAVMSDEGRKNIRVAKSLYEFGQKTGDEDLMKRAAQMGQEVRLTPSSYDYDRSEAYHKFAYDRDVTRPNTDANGRTIYTPNEWEQEQNKKWGTAVGQGLKGGFLTLLETARKATRNAIENRYDPEYQSKKYTADYIQHKANGEQDEREKIRLNAEAGKMRTAANEAEAKEGIGTDTPGMQALRASSEATQDLVNNADTKGGKLLTKAGISILQMAPFLAANAIPGVGQAVSLGGMGALAAGQKAGELQQDSKVSAQEALGRGLISGGIEAFTEKIPMDNLLKVVKGGGGASFIKNMAKQAGIEATEESASYAMNWLADKAAQDPKAKFSLSDLAENAAVGAISGGIFGAGGHVIGNAMTAGRTPYKRTSPVEDTTSTPTVEEAPRPIQEQPTQESANPLIRASQAQEQMRTQAQEQAQANQDTRAQMQSARERLAQARQELAQREAAWQERAASATEEEVPNLLREQENLLQEERQIQAQETQAEREDAGQLSRNFGEESAHIDQRTAGDVSKPSVKAFQWDYPQMHQYYAQAAEALLQDVEYSKAGQFSEKGRGTVVTKSEAMMQVERMGISRADLEKALTAIINDQGQENYATAKKVELVLDEMLSKGYIPNEAGYSADKVDSRVPPNEAYIMAKESIPGAVKRGSFEAYKEQNRLALELGEVTEDQLYQEWEQDRNAIQPQTETQDTQVQTQPESQVQQNTDEIPATFDEYKAQFQDAIDSREMTEGQLLDEYNAVKRRNERLQRRGEPIRRTRIEPQYTDTGLRDSLGSARAGFDPYSQAMNRYGTIEPGENPARIVDVPQSMTGSDRVRKFARTAMEAGVTSDKTVELLQKAVVDGEFSYTPKKMNELADRAIDALSTPQNAAKSMALWEEVVNGDRAVTDDDIALGIMMMKAAEQSGDSRTASQLAGEIAAFGTELGRGVNALRLLKKATPEGKLFYIRKSVDKLNQNIQRRNKNNKTATNGKKSSDLSDLSYQDITVPDDLAQQLVNAKTQEAQDAAIDEIYDYVADRVPKDTVMRMDAWRYFAMLGNPRTHMRNVDGNVLMQGVTRSSNLTSAALQHVIIKNASERTRTGIGTREAHRFAKADFEKNKDLLTGNPYTTSETGQIMQRVREKAFTVDANKREKSAFWRAVDTAMKPMHKLSDFNAKALDWEDMFFKRWTYIDSMANFLTARGYGKNLDSVPENVLQEARTHAIDDALEATFQQYSELASKLAQMEASNKVGQFLIGGTFPFKRVPINIAKTAVKFSPAGLIKTMTSDAKKLRNGDITAADFCDNLGAGLNGSGLAVLGAFLFANGILTVGGDDDDKQAGFDAAMGSQEYAINLNIGGKTYSYTIDWAAPAVVPMFIGAEFWNAIKTKDEEASFTKAAMNAVGRMFEPLMQMTMLSGVSSTIKSAAYNQQDPIYGVLANVATNYAGQFVPTVLGQVARTIDPIRRTTFADANSKVPKEIQQFLQRQGAKIPGLSEKMPEYLDAWGRNDMGDDNLLIRAIDNFISPGYRNKVSTSSMESELQRLHDAGYEGMLPSALQKSSKLDGNRMTAEQWMKRQKEQGSVAYEIMQNFMGTQEYKDLTDDQKAKFVDKAYEFAKNKGKAAAGGDTSDFARWYNAAENAQSEVGLSAEKFLSIYAYKSAIEDEAGDDAKASIKQGMWEDYVNGRSDLSQDQKDYVLDQVKFWNMIPADSGAYQKAKNAGYNTPQEIQALLEAKKGFDTDGNGSYSTTELYEGIKKATSDPAEQEKMWNATKNANMDKTWSEVTKEQAAQEPQRQKGEQALNSLSDDKKQAFASAGEQYNTNSYNGIYDTVMSVDATDAEREAYYNYINSKRSKPWKKTWAEAKAKVEKERKK